MDEEQQIILRMLKEGKVSVEEADALLKTLAEQEAAEEAEAADRSEAPELGEAQQARHGPGAPTIEITGLREELREIISEIIQTVPKEVVKGMKIGVRGVHRHGLFNLVQGLRGLEEAQAEFTVSEAMNPGETLEVRNAWGDVHLEPSAGTAMALTAQVRVWGPTVAEAQQVASSLSIEKRRQGSTVIVAVPRLEGWRVRADLTIRVPAGVNVGVAEAKGDLQARGLTGSLRAGVAAGDIGVDDHRGAVDIEVKSGDLTLRGIEGDVHIDVKSGDVSATQVRGAVRGRVISGDVEVEAHGAGDVALDVINGDLTVGGAGGSVTLETKSGDVHLRRLHSQAVRVRAISGDVSAEVETLTGGEIQVDTVSGDIELEIPEQTRATIEASARSGEVSCTLPLQQRSGDRRAIRGILNGPGARIMLRALSGDIDLRARR